MPVFRLRVRSHAVIFACWCCCFAGVFSARKMQLSGPRSFATTCRGRCWRTWRTMQLTFCPTATPPSSFPSSSLMPQVPHHCYLAVFLPGVILSALCRKQVRFCLVLRMVLIDTGLTIITALIKCKIVSAETTVSAYMPTHRQPTHEHADSTKLSLHTI